MLCHTTHGYPQQLVTCTYMCVRHITPLLRVSTPQAMDRLRLCNPYGALQSPLQALPCLRVHMESAGNTRTRLYLARERLIRAK